MLVIRAAKPRYPFGPEGKERGDPTLTRSLNDRPHCDPSPSARAGVATPARAIHHDPNGRRCHKTSIELLIGRIASVLEIIPAFLRGIEVADVAESFPKVIDGPCSNPPKVCLEFGESHLDGIEVRAVGRSEQEPGAAIFEDSGGLLALMAGKIVEDHDITGIERGSQLGFYPCFENHTVHGAVDDPGRDDTIAT